MVNYSGQTKEKADFSVRHARIKIGRIQRFIEKERLGVTFQAISGWERGEGYTDMLGESLLMH